MPLELEPIPLWTGHYVLPDKARDFAGADNLAKYSRLDPDATTEDPAVLQRYADQVDAYVNFLAKFVHRWDDADVPIATGHALFTPISDAATQLFIAEVYGARGMNDPANNSDAGKMMDKRARAEARLAELLVTRGTVATADDAPDLVAGLSLQDQFTNADLCPDDVTTCCPRASRWPYTRGR